MLIPKQSSYIRMLLSKSYDLPMHHLIGELEEGSKLLGGRGICLQNFLYQFHHRGYPLYL
ncbi:hypothetical protein BaRGS_00013015, partial [Batillaria attramentaria]